MAFLSAEELKATYYKKAANMDPDDLATYLARANSFSKGVIGGDPPVIDADLKAAVALAFEIFSKDETAQEDEETGNITEAAQQGAFVRNKQRDPLQVVTDMLAPYKAAFQAANSVKSDRGVMFL